jgi:hypothetical protein
MRQRHRHVPCRCLAILASFGRTMALSANKFALCALVLRTKLGSCFWTTPIYARISLAEFHQDNIPPFTVWGDVEES